MIWPLVGLLVRGGGTGWAHRSGAVRGGRL